MRPVSELGGDGEAAARRTEPAIVAALLALMLILVVQSVALAPPGSNVSAWWPAAGVAAGLLLLTPPRTWRVVLVLIAGTAYVGNLLAGRPWELALAYAPLNSLEAWTFATAIGAHRGTPRLLTGQDLRRLLVAAATAALVVATGAVVAVQLVVGHHNLGRVLLDVAAAHTAALVAVVPLFLHAQAGTAARVSVTRGGAAQITLTVLVTTAAFWPGQSLPLAFVPLPFVVWSAKVLPARVVSAEVLALCVLVTALTAARGGPFGASSNLSPESRGALVQVFVLTLAVVAHALVVAVTQRQLALREAIEARDLYQRGISESVIGTLLLRRAGDQLLVLEVNAPALDLLGARAADLAGQPWTAGLTNDDQVRIAQAAAELESPGTAAWQRELWLVGEPPRCVRVSMVRLPNTAWGDLLTVQLVDLTQERRAEVALRQERAFSVTLMGAVRSAGLLGLDGAGRILYFGRGASDLLGIEVDRVVGRPVAELEVPGQPDLLSHVLGHADQAGEGVEGVVDRRWRRADGSEVVVSVSATPLVLPGTDDLGYLLLATDVSEARRSEAALTQALEHERAAVQKLHELDRAKTDLVSSVSHELRTPMTSILGYLQVLERETFGTLNETQRDLLGRVGRGGRRLLSLVENILTLSRIESVSDTLVRRRVRLDTIVAGPLEDAINLGRVSGVRVVEVGAVPDAELDGDQEQLERALLNVLSNALKFSRAGAEVLVRYDWVGDGRVAVSVEDTGVGIPPDELSRLGEPFFRASTATDGAVPGTGLGLAIVNAIVDGHGGAVVIDSRLGHGTRVQLVLPATPVPVPRAS